MTVSINNIFQFCHNSCFLKETREGLLKLLVILTCALWPITSYAELPVPDANEFVSSGVATIVQDATTATINQATDRAVLNWQSFNIGKDNTVNFVQPNVTSSALNRINQASPSQIFGNLNANGQVFLINNNGIVFGQGAQINVGGLTASTLDVSDEVFNDLNIVTAITDGQAAFEGGTNSLAQIVIEEGSQIRTSEGGRVLVFAPEVSNQGTIETPGGQSILGGAQDRVYLYAADSDSGIRGLFVELGTGGSVENLGDVIAERGNITLIGQAVRQAGSLSATTSVQENGSIRLLARDNARLNNPLIPTGAEATRTGELLIDNGSTVILSPDSNSTSTASDNIPQVVSSVELMGRTIEFKSDSTIRVTGGSLDVVATTNPATESLPTIQQDSRIFIDSDVIIDVSGDKNSEVSVSRYEVTAEIRSNELADTPVQKNGVLQDQEVLIDARIGTEVADVSNAVGGIERTAAERLSVGGNIELRSDGDIIIKEGSLIDVSGGQVTNTSGVIQTTQLVTVDNTLVNISDADPNVEYQAVSSGPASNFVEGYVEGKDGGSISLVTYDAVLEGEFKGDITRGQFQRELPTVLAGSPGYTRNFRESPARAQFNLDLNINEFTPRDVFISSNIIAESPALEINTVLPENHVVNLGNALFNDSGIGEFNISVPRLSSSIILDVDSSLFLPELGKLQLNAFITELGSSLISSGGTLGVDSEIIRINNGSDISVAGLWVNDAYNIIFEQSPSQELIAIDGGSVTLSGKSEVTISSGSEVNVSGGAYLPVSGDLLNVRAGDAGAISILTNPTPVNNDDAILKIDGTLVGHALVGATGGSLEIQANAIEINSSGEGVDESVTYLSDDFLSQGGFQAYSLISTRNGITVDDTANINSVVENFLLNSDAIFQITGTPFEDVSTIRTFPEYLRTAPTLTLSALQTSVVNNEDKGLGDLIIQNGANLSVDSQGGINLVSDGSILINGSVSAPAGFIDIDIISPTYDGQDLGFLADQYVWLSDTAVLDVSGTVVSQPSEISFDFPDQNTVLDSGSISISTDRGYIISQDGSLFDISGSSATTQLLDGLQIREIELFSDAGDINLSTSSGLIFNGRILAHADDASASNGELNVLLDRNPNIDPLDLVTGARISPDTPRIIELSNNNLELDFIQDAEVDDSFHGKAFLNLSDIESFGFDKVKFSLNTGNRASGTSLIKFNNDIDFNVRQSIFFDVPVIDIQNHNIKINSNYIGIGPNLRGNQFNFDQELSGSGSLNLNASIVDLVGDVGIKSANSIVINSSGDVRLIGVPNLDFDFDNIEDIFGFTDSGSLAGNEKTDGLLAGSFNFNGDLTIDANQIYPTTLSKFSFINQDKDNGLVQINSPNDALLNDTLSALGSLLIESPFILNNGNIRAPNGRINLLASKSLVLSDNSVTSVSLNDENVLLGRTEAGEWAYTIETDNDFLTVIFDQLPESFIQFESENIDFSENAVVDITGGGELLAYEHIPGPNGSIDILDIDVNPEYYAILPTFDSGYVAYDIAESSNTNIPFGSEIIIDSPAGNLAAGRYTLLPARYSLLPGAFLVRPETRSDNLNTSQTFIQADGSTFVTGRLAIANTQIVDNVSQGFSIVDSENLIRFAEYDITKANSFFEKNTPNDAKRISFLAGGELNLAGSILASANAGSAGLVDIISDKIAIINTETNRVVGNDFLLISDDVLQSINARSISIGASRSNTAEGTKINSQASEVLVAEDVELSTSELLLSAIESVTVEQGVNLNTQENGLSVDNTPQLLLLEGDGALLRISSNDQVSLLRTNASGNTGDLFINDGSLIGTSNSISLDATGSFALGGQIASDSGSLNLSSTKVTFNEASTSGLSLDLSSLNFAGLSELIITSQSSIDIAGDIDLDIDNLIFDAAQISNISNGLNVISASNFTLTNSTGNKSLSTTGNNGQLVINSDNILLSNGIFTLDGYESVTFNATNQVGFDGLSQLNFDGADINIFTPQLIGADGSELYFAANNSDVVIDNTDINQLISSSTTSVAAKLEFNVNSLLFNSTFKSSGGNLIIQSNENIEIGDTALIDLAGSQIDFFVTEEPINGGVLDLTSSVGDISVLSGARIDVSADVESGNAGSLKIEAVNGMLAFEGSLFASAAQGHRSGNVDVSVQALDSFSVFNQKLNNAGAFNRRHIQVGTGDIVIANGEVVKSADIELVADQGSVILNSDSQIDASGELGGDVRLVALDDIQLNPNAKIDISADEDSSNDAGNLRLEVSSDEGQINLLDGGIIDLLGGENGGVNGQIFARISANNLEDRVVLNANGLSSASQATLAALLKQEFNSTDVLNQSYIDNSFDLAINSINLLSPAFLDAIANDNFQIIPSIQILGENLTSAGNLNLSTSRFNGLPGELTLRSQGNLNINHDISDGFNNSDLLLEDNSWTFNLIAGSDLDSADIFTTIADAGSITLGQNVRVRTGTGDIQIHSGGDLNLLDSTSVIYTAGKNAGFGTFLDGNPQFSVFLAGAQYGTDGGDLTLVTRGDIDAVIGSDQFVNEWLVRLGQPIDGGVDLPTTWAVNYNNFEQGFAALGGGDVTITSGGDANNLSASIPTVALHQGDLGVNGFTYTDNTFEVLNQGNLNIDIEGDINGSKFYVENGNLEIFAGGNIGEQTSNGSAALFALGSDTQVKITAFDDLNINGIVNPFLLPQGSEQDLSFINQDPQSYFTTYRENASFNATSLTGHFNYLPNTDAINADNLLNENFSGFLYIPGTVKFVSLQNDILLGDNLRLDAVPFGNIDILAHGNISTLGSQSVTVQTLANNRSLIPTPEFPTTSSEEILAVSGFFSDPSIRFSTTPVHLNDFENSRIVARNGNIDALEGSLRLVSAEPVSVFAGQDIVSLRVDVLHSKEEDTTTIQAGRDFLMPSDRNQNGSLRPNNNQVVVSGEGSLEVIAGRNVNLGSSQGISTIGDTLNPFLEDQGADILILAGITPEFSFQSGVNTNDLTLLLDQFKNGELGNQLLESNISGVDGTSRSTITNEDELRQLDDLQQNIQDQIILFAENLTGTTDLSIQQASNIFDGASQNLQRQVYSDVLFDVVRASSILASTGGSDGGINSDRFDLAFGILELFFPESQNLDGNLIMFNSSIETIEGGDIGIIVPAGQIDAGLPSVVAGAASTDELGIITQREGDINIISRDDVNVNRSRIFALGGGDQLFWSSLGNVDAGRGAQDKLEIPAPITSIDENGNIVTEFPAGISGSGIRTASTIEGVEPGDIVFGVPNGVVDAGDAGIDVGGNLILAAEEVIGRDNFSVGGEVSGVQLSEAGPPIALTTQADSTSASVSDSVEGNALGAADEQAAGSLGSQALKWLEVFVLGYGEDETASLDVNTCDDPVTECEG